MIECCSHLYCKVPNITVLPCFMGKGNIVCQWSISTRNPILLGQSSPFSYCFNQVRDKKNLIFRFQLHFGNRLEKVFFYFIFYRITISYFEEAQQKIL